MTQRRLRLLFGGGKFRQRQPRCMRCIRRTIQAGSDRGIDGGYIVATIKVWTPVILLDLSLNLREPMDPCTWCTGRRRECLWCVCDPREGAGHPQLTEGAIDFILKGQIDEPTLETRAAAALGAQHSGGLTDLLRDQVPAVQAGTASLTIGRRHQEEAVRSGGSMVLICCF